eukprot:6480629-Amphidinium_carterae.1
MNTADNNGLEAWRVLKKFYEPTNRASMRLRMDQLLRPRIPDKLEHVINAIETWEREVREYEKRHQKTLDDDVKLATMLGMAPEAVKRHVYLNESNFSDYATARQLVTDYIEHQTLDMRAPASNSNNSNNSQPTPMEIDALTKGKGKGGKSKGKDKGAKNKGKGGKSKGKYDQQQQQPQQGAKSGKQGKGSQEGRVEGYCGLCGKWGHTKRVCYQNPQNQGKGNGGK